MKSESGFSFAMASQPFGDKYRDNLGEFFLNKE